MGDEERRKFIVANLPQLTDFTVIGPEFVIRLLAIGLIDDGESHIFSNSNTPNVTKAFMLYNETGKRWSSAQFEDFKRVLQETKNFSALKVLNNFEITTSTVETTQISVRNKEPAPNDERQNQIKQTNPQFNQNSKTNESKISNESRFVEDESQIAKKGISVKELGRKLDSSGNITTSGNNTKGRNKTTNIELTNHKDGALVNSLSSLSSVSDRSRDLNKTELLKKVGSDWNLYFEEIEVAWKLVKTLSQEELYCLITNEETRVVDHLGWPIYVSVHLGEELVPRGIQLAEFRGRFFEQKGQTLFEMSTSGFDFAVKVLWVDLLREMHEGNNKGPVTVALREATGRIERGDLSGWKLIRELEDHVKKRSRNECSSQERISMGSRHSNWKNSYVTTAIVLVDWVTEGVQLWNDNDAASSTPLEALPFLVRYSRNIPPNQLRKILEGSNNDELKDESNLLAVLRSLVILSSKDYKDDGRCYSEVAAFLERNIESIPGQLTVFTRRIISEGADSKQIVPYISCSSDYNQIRLVGDVSVGAVFLGLISTSSKETVVDQKLWEFVVGDIIKFTSCCDLPSVLQELQKMLATDTKLLKEVLMSEGVIRKFGDRFWSGYRITPDDDCHMCGLRHLLSFYFSVFGNNCEWMKKKGWTLVAYLPVEISAVLQEFSMSKNSTNINLRAKFEEMMRQFFGQKKIRFVNRVAACFYYNTEDEWESLLNIIGGEDILQGGVFRADKIFFTSMAAPLIRVLLRKFGPEWTRAWLRTHHLWGKIPSCVHNRFDTVETFGSLLHSAVQLGELSEVKKRAWPGIISWRNSEGKTALEVAKEMTAFEDKHQIIVYLQDRVSSLNKTRLHNLAN